MADRLTNHGLVVIGRHGIPQSFAAAAENRSRPPNEVRPPY